MNPLIRELAEAMAPESGTVMGLITLSFMGLFLAWAWYAYAPSRSGLMDTYGRLPLDDGDEQ